MGQIANQMAFELYLKMKGKIKEKIERIKGEKSHQVNTRKERIK